MKKIVRKLVAVLVCISMFSTFFPMDGIVDLKTAFAAENEFVIVDGVLTEYNGTKLIVRVPDGVTEIAASAFRCFGNSKKLCVEKVILPDSVEIIDDWAFYGCGLNLTSVEMSPNVYYIGRGAFSGCENLQTIDLSDTKIEVVQKQTFDGCSILSEVLLPDTVKVIGEKAFSECKKLGRVGLNEGLVHIGNSAFSGCAGMNSINLPTTLTTIGESAFEKCLSLISIKIPAGVTEIPPYCFNGDYSMKSIYLPDTLEVINYQGIKTSNYIVPGPGSMKNIFIPESVKVMHSNSIDDGNLYGESPIEEYRAFPDSAAYQTLKNLQDNGKKFAQTQFVSAQYDSTINFDACGGNLEETSKRGVKGQMFGGLPTPSLKGWTFKGWYADKGFENKITCLSIIDKDEYTLYARWEKESAEEIKYKGEADDFVIKDGKLIDYTGRQSVVVVPDGVTDIGSVFKDKPFITEVVLPDSVTKMGELSDCSALIKINIPDGVTEIVANGFAKCTALEEIAVGKNVTTIGRGAFHTCSSLEKITLPDNLVSIPGNETFYKCQALKEIILPETLENLGTYSFSYCYALSEIAVPGKVKTLPRGMFSKCYMLKSVRLGDGIESIEREVFSDCNSLKSIYIPESAQSVDYQAFSNINDQNTDFEIKGFSGSSAFDAYEAIASSCSNINVTFTKMNYDSVIEFDSESCGQAIESKKAVMGQIYGVLPEVEKTGYTFNGWSDGKKIMKSTSDVESDKVTLSATWIKEGETLPDPEEEKEGTPTLLPPSDTEQSENLEYTDISTPEQLYNVRNNMSGNYRLVADIDLSQVPKDSEIFDEFGFRPLGISEDGSVIEGFTGIFDGNGHQITGLWMEGQVPYKNVGLFARIEGGTVKNLNLADCKISIGNKPVLTGALAGYIGENSETLKEAVVDNIKVSGYVTFSAFSDVPTQNIAIGGIFGYIGNADVSNCHNKADVAYYTNEEERPETACSRFLGGVTGYVQGGSLSRSSNSGSVLGYRKYFGIFDNAVPGDWVSATISGLDVYDVAGGVCGVAAEDGFISECYNVGNVYSYMYNTHELFTLNASSHMDTMSGGIVGALYRSTKVADCYNTGKMYSNSTVDTTILDEQQYFSPDRMNSYMALLDSVTVNAPQNATAYAGGIIGFSHNNAAGPVVRCFNTGRIEGSENHAFPISNGNVPAYYCRYLNNDGNQKGSEGYDDKLQMCKGISSEEMQDEYSYRNFDFANTWLYAEGMDYPQLYRNMQSSVQNVEFISSDMPNSNVAYGKDLDLSGFKVSFNIRGIANPIVVSVQNSRECGYDRYKEGAQHLVLDYFGVQKEFDIVVEPKHVHDYEMIFNWDDDYKGCTAKWTCKEKDREKAVDCKVKETKEEADYEKEGNITYTATAAINGQEYTDTKVVTLEKLQQTDLGRATLKYNDSYDYSGVEITPWIQVYDENGKILNSSYYEISYMNNVNAGKGRVIVKAKEGNCPYTGEVEGEFTINKAKVELLANVDTNEMQIGNSTKLMIYQSSDKVKLTYTSKNPSVAKVNRQGVITAVAPGNTKIIVSGTGNDNYETVPCEIDIKVCPNTPAINIVENKSNGICVKWKKDAVAAGYEIYRSTGNGSYKLVKTIKNNKTTAWTDTKAKSNGAYYRYKVLTYYTSSGDMVKSEASGSKKIVRLCTPKIKSVSNQKKGTCCVCWSINKNASAYQIKYQTGKTVKSVRVSGKATVKKAIASLKKGKTYRISVRAIMKKGASEYYSSWSPAKNIKITK